MPKIYGNTEILGGDLTVLGNMVISGTQTSLNVEELIVSDNIITLNGTFSGAPVLDSGIEINRGTGTFSRLIWNETTDYWVAGLSGSESVLVTDASNGLTKTNDGISLGGVLTTNTTITMGSNTLDILGNKLTLNNSDIDTLTIGNSTSKGGIIFNSGYGNPSTIYDRNDGTHSKGMTLQSRDNNFEFISSSGGTGDANIQVGEISKARTITGDVVRPLILRGGETFNDITNNINIIAVI